MHIFHQILFIVLALATVGMVTSGVVMMANACSADARGYRPDGENRAFTAFLAALAVAMLDMVLLWVVYLWQFPAAPRPLLVCLVAAVVIHAVHAVPSARAVFKAGWLKLFGRADTPLAPIKKPWLSKTIVLNTVVAALLLAEANIASLQGLLPANKYQVVAFVLPILNMVLRAYTTQGLSFKPAVPQGEADK